MPTSSLIASSRDAANRRASSFDMICLCFLRKQTRNLTRQIITEKKGQGFHRALACSAAFGDAAGVRVGEIGEEGLRKHGRNVVRRLGRGGWRDKSPHDGHELRDVDCPMAVWVKHLRSIPWSCTSAPRRAFL